MDNVVRDTFELVQPRLQVEVGKPGPPFRVRVRGRPDHDYVLQASTNLTQWTALATNRSPDGTVLFVDPESAGTHCRFYRAHSPSGDWQADCR